MNRNTTREDLIKGIRQLDEAQGRDPRKGLIKMRKLDLYNLHSHLLDVYIADTQPEIDALTMRDDQPSGDDHLCANDHNDSCECGDCEEIDPLTLNERDAADYAEAHPFLAVDEYLDGRLVAQRWLALGKTEAQIVESRDAVRSLSFSPDPRFQSSMEFVQELDRYLARLAEGQDRVLAGDRSPWGYEPTAG